ncbi:NERD domain-containing protein [Flavobacteriales bacterium]|nr:NERD domain-containing protein [Flavobacteriales bacterium]
MAIINPPIETIKILRQKPTEGELHLLEFLEKTLDNTYEVFFQPFLNGDLPDIVIMRKGSGVYVIEVKDWNLEAYRLTEYKQWEVKTENGNWHDIKSPISQVFSYKENLYNLHIAGLLERRIKNPKLLYVVNCGVYFHNASTSHCNSFAKKKFSRDEESDEKRRKYDSYLKFISYFDLIGFDTLKPEDFKKIMNKRWMSKTSYLFDSELYDSFKRHLQPPKHTKDQGIPITYSKEQERIIESKSNSKQKVKGVAGSGKTLCLAKRIVNAHLRHGNKVLVLTFNISLRNYIHDKINEVREDFAWSNFHIVHYHEFFKNQANNHNLKLKGLDAWHNQRFFEEVKDSIEKYDTIVIDEIQDYTEPWINIILNYFLAENGEYVVYGDEKQNIYQRSYDHKEKKPYTKVGGQWNLLKRSYRITNEIARLAESFQKWYFSEKYEIDEIAVQKSLFEQSELRYYLLDSFSAEMIIKLYKEIASELEVHENDICFQSSQVELLRELGFKIRSLSSQKTNTMFETQEVYDKLKADYGKTDKFFKELEQVRRNKKFNYWNNRGLLKMSTIHSFKGWEVDTLFLLIDSEKEDKSKDFTSDELIYTAITRCRTNLIVININNPKYHDFFKEKIGITQSPAANNV